MGQGKDGGEGRARITGTKRETRWIGGESSLGSSKANTVHSSIIENFVSKFQLTDTEISALSVTDITSMDFFLALKRAREIHKDCAILLQTEHQRAA
jgi:hypothetical protein